MEIANNYYWEKNVHRSLDNNSINLKDSKYIATYRKQYKDLK